MMKYVLPVIISALTSTITVFLVMGPVKKPRPEQCKSQEQAIDKNRAKVKQLVLQDVSKYGLDIYRIYTEFTHAIQAAPGMDFGVDKALKKLQVTYPNSEIRKLAEAYAVIRSIPNRDIIRIMNYLKELEETNNSDQLTPTGMMIEPQLRIAVYNYYFATGKLDKALQELEILEKKFPDEQLQQLNSAPVSLKDFINQERTLIKAGLNAEVR